MDPNAYKDFKTSRGFTYHYYVCGPSQDNKATILFSHGFPSTSYDWHNQVDFFKDKGYGVLVPDMLGYGGTDKPTTPASYRMSLMALDIVEILNNEKIGSVVAVGHDWGSGLTSRLAVYYPERFLAFGFLAVSYTPPNPNFNYEELLATSEKALGYATVGYWSFFSEDDAHKVLEEHLDSFLSLGFCKDPSMWRDHLAPLGKAKEWLLSDKKTEVASYLSEEELGRLRSNIMKGGFAGPTCWYKAMMQKHTSNEEAEIPTEKYIVKKPVFFGAALRDYICIAPAGKLTTQKTCPNATIVDFDTDHWINLAAPEKLNAELLKWIQSLEPSWKQGRL
ncbi:hypothetical protein M0805_004795 [Coniferiporia weirii]|nr:hypothetical protein M0805_004795 [Coniferiporia weirii]